MDELEQSGVAAGGEDAEVSSIELAAASSEGVPAPANEPAGDAAGIAESGGEPAGPPAQAGSGEGTDPEVERIRTELVAARAEVAAARSRGVESHRRALLAENAGGVVPELVSGESVEALDASLEVARAAHQRVRDETVAELATSARVGAGNGVRGTALDVEAMSPMQKIAHGLKRE